MPKKAVNVKPSAKKKKSLGEGKAVETTLEKSVATAKLKITQVKSFIGRKGGQELSLRALGLGRIGKSRVLLDVPETRGLVDRVKHLVTIEVV